MHTLQTGIFLQSTQLLNDTLFEGTTILVAEYNAAGALGFIINKPFGRTLNELVEFQDSQPIALYNGGPVDQEHLFFIHKRPELIEGGVAISDSLHYGGNFQQAVERINTGELSDRDVMIFVGYCGWDAGDLEAEIEEGSWVVTDNQPGFFI